MTRLDSGWVRMSGRSRVRFAMALLRLAALLHDVGKAPKAFQEKLQRGRGAEVLRHDLLSFLILAESLYAQGNSDREWLALLVRDPAAVAACVTSWRLLPLGSEWLQRVERRLLADRSVLLSTDELQTLNTSRPGLLVVLWLVLTHHRLPLSSGMGQVLDPGAHLNVPTDDTGSLLAPLSECLEPADGVKPWEEARWLQAVASAAQEALAALDELAKDESPLEQDATFWPKVAAHLLRPTLVLADHLAAQQAPRGAHKTVAFGKGVVFANTYGDKHMGDDLTTHLLRTDENAQALLLRTLDASEFPHTTLPSERFEPGKPVPDAFAWQPAFLQTCRTAAQSGPVFAAVIAETGAGKTIGGLCGAYGLTGGSVRLSVAFALRSLTWQTAKSYTGDLGLPESVMTVAVGQPQTLELDVKARVLQDTKMLEPRPGSESSVGAGTVDAALSRTELKLGWLDGLMGESEARRLWGDKALAMISAPVLACTADHLVRAVSLLRGGDARLFLRLATSDLLLDEIDAYSAGDLQSIGKLVFVAGLSGRNVIAMSATLTPAIFEGLHAAWRQGVQARALLLQATVKPALVLCANTVAPEVHTAQSEQDAVVAWTRYVERVCRVYSNTACIPRRRRLEVCSWTARTRAEAFTAITDGAIRAHSLNAVQDPATNKRVSVGCVRLNTAKSAWAYGNYLSRSGSNRAGVRILFVPYHSKFPRNYLGVLDAVLGQVASRKQGEFAHLTFPALRRVLDTTPEQDVLVIVSSTTLVETGRDFDFDWGICEPMSARGTVQFVGRIRRHRHGAWDQPNVFLLPCPLRALERPTDGSKPLWSRPGIEDAIANLRLTMDLPDQLAAAPLKNGGLRRAARVAPGRSNYAWQTQDVLPIELWRERIDAQVCLQDDLPYASNRIGFIEHRAQARQLTAADWSGSEAVPDSLRRYLSTLAPLNALHARLTPFRGEQQAQALFIPTDAGVEYVDPVYGTRLPCRSAQLLAVPADHALVPDLQAQAQALDAEGDVHIVGCALHSAEGGPALTPLSFSPVLGFLEA